MSFELRPCANPEEFQSALLGIGQYFGMEPGDELSQQLARLLPVERMRAVWDGPEIVAGAGSLPLTVSVPGGEVTCSGTTVVGVSPTRRRRGLLRQLMRVELDEAHERDDPLAILWASEEPIYGRFGYGQAAYSGEVSIRKSHTAFAIPYEQAANVSFVEADEALEAFPPLWKALARERPGVPGRSRDWWQYRALAAPRRGGKNRFVLLELDGSPAAYAIYSHHPKWETGVASGAVVVTEAVGVEPAAIAGLWRFLLDIDWIETITTSLIPPDHPLFFLLVEPRRIGYRRGDGLWARLVDVGAALSKRTYPVEPDLVFEVRDEFCPWNEGRWHLAGETAERTDGPADLALDVSALASAYLGGIGFAQLAQVGRVEELTSGAVERADSAFRHGLHPWCPEIF
ncbi:MAG TPA: GNAT family N-acetyltransferase [Gaiellaceae bacterium]|jgi:predicted acetyltransferase|nr:GNAT family N-acetyltransferase [Gaiellaceae bacterium]